MFLLQRQNITFRFNLHCPNIVILLSIDNSLVRTHDVVILSAIAMLREQQGQPDNAVTRLSIGRTDVKVLRFKNFLYEGENCLIFMTIK